MTLQEIITKAIPIDDSCPQKRANAIYRRSQLEKRIRDYIDLRVKEILKEHEIVLHENT